MPAGYRIDTERHAIFSTASGVLTDDDLRGHQKRILADPAFDPSFNQVWDLREVTEVSVSNRALQDLAAARSFSPGAKRAMVAPSDILYGMARMFQLMHDAAPEQVRVFREIAEAEDWIRLD